MQNHLEISSKSKFGTGNVRNLTKTLTSVMSGPTLDSRNEETHKGKYMEHIQEIYIFGIYKEYMKNIHKD